MAATTPNTVFEYTVDSDGIFPNKRVDIPRFTEEIRASSISVALRGITIASGNCVIEFSGNASSPPGLSSAEILVLDTLVTSHTGEPLPVGAATVTLSSPSNPENKIPLFSLAGREGSEVIYATHNYCDKTTWYSQSLRAESETLVDSGNGLTWGSAHTHWVDMYSGKVMDDDGVRTDVSHGYSVVVTANGVEKTMREVYEDNGGDYTVDFAAGTVTFFSVPTGPVVATYSYADGSAWILRASPGKNLDVESAETQFSTDVEITDSIVFTFHGYAAVFAPAAVAANLLQPTDLVEIGRDTYKRFTQIIDNAIGSFPVVPAIGGAARGTQHAVYGFPFRYGTLRRIYSEYGMELRVFTKHGRVLPGEYATTTFYCVSR